MKYFMSDYKAGADFLRHYAATDKSAKMAQIADMLEYSGALIALETGMENGPDYMDRMLFEHDQLKERVKRLKAFRDRWNDQDPLWPTNDLTPQQRTQLLSAMGRQLFAMEEYLNALNERMQIEAEIAKVG